MEVSRTFKSNPEHVSKRFGGRTILDDVSLQVKPGGAICMLGRSDTGQERAAKIMIGLIQPDDGKKGAGGETRDDFCPVLVESKKQ